MMKTACKSILAVAFFILTGLYAFPQLQGDEVLLDIAGDPVTVEEFLYVYKKNNPSADQIDTNDMKEYLDLYINFRLKVREAMELGMDTVQKFKDELEGYRKQLAQPYFRDSELEEQLMEEAYERLLIDVRASHILVRLDKNALPGDTLAAYNRAIEARNRILNGEAFGDVAAEVSDDPSAKDTPGTDSRPPRKGNRGDLGYFTVFDMVYPFENGAYTTMVDEISLPVRTDYGYHLIYVTDRQPALGQVQVAHIYVANPKEDTDEARALARQKIDSAYRMLQDGAVWDDVTLKFSEDIGTYQNGGVLPWFGANRMVPEFIRAVRGLLDSGGYSEPVHTSFGWHIIKFLDRKPIGTFEEEKSGIQNRLAKDARFQLTEDVVLERIKNEYGFTEYPGALDEVAAMVDTSVISGNWDPEVARNLDEKVFTLGNRDYTQYDFAKYVASRQNRRIGDIRAFVIDQYKWYVEESCTAYENERLEVKYPEFRMLVQEYHDGILLFELTDQKVWSKAGRDTTGLKQFYEDHKDNYMWKERLDAAVFTLNDNYNVNPDSLRMMVESGLEADSIIAYFNKTLEAQKKTPFFPISGGRDLYERGTNKIVDQIKWKKGFTGPVSATKGTGYAFVYGVLKPQPKKLDEVRGLVTADYQNYLEDLWIRDLRSKYNVVVNQEILSQIR